MSRCLTFAFLVYAAASAQAVVAPHVAIAGARPEFLLLAAVTAALAMRGWPVLAWAAVVGLVGDCLSERPLGVEMLAATVVILFVQRTLHAPPERSVVRHGVIGTVAIALIVVSREAATAALVRDSIAPGALLSTSATAALYSAVIGLLFYGIWRGFRESLCRIIASPTW